jgi:hypothetical protein
MFFLDVLDHLKQAAPLVESQRNAGLCRFDSAVLCHVVLSDVDASVSGGHRHVPRCADVQTQLDFFISDQLVDRIINLVKELDELRPAWISERRHLIRSIFKQTDLVILYYNKTFLADFKRLKHFRRVIVECECCDIKYSLFGHSTVLSGPIILLTDYHVNNPTHCYRRQQPDHSSIHRDPTMVLFTRP